MAKKQTTRKSLTERAAHAWQVFRGREQQPKRVRNWNGAKNSRFTSNFVERAHAFFDDEIKLDVLSLRSRARDAEKNNPYVSRYLRVIQYMVIGPQGLRLRMAKRSRVDGLPDTFANTLLEGEWETFSKAVTVDGLDLRNTLNLFLQQTARDGEMFAIIHRGNSFGSHKIQLQMLEAEYLDINFNGKLTNGHVIVQGIEYDKLYRRIAYHFLKELPRSQADQQTTLSRVERMRIPAKDVIHTFRRDRVAQTRGIPWFAASLRTLAQIDEYTATELFASQMAAAKQGFITQQNKEGDLPGDEDPNDDRAVVWEAGTGDIPVLPPGMTLQSWDPTHPHGNFATFVKSCLRRFSVDVGLSYNTVAGDLESTSYSSGRIGMIDERATFRQLQVWLIETVLDRLFEEWLRMVLDLGQLGLRDTFDEYNRPHWRCPKWEWVDPQKETNAIKIQLDYKIKSRSEVARALGTDYQDVLDEIAEEIAYAKTKGIDLEDKQVADQADAKLLAQIEQLQQQIDDGNES